MIYFDNAATTLQKPPCVAEAVVQAMTTLGNCGRGACAPGLAASRTVYQVRTKIASLLGCPKPGQVAFTANATQALNTALFGLLKPGGRVIATDWEHNSVLRPLHRLAAERGVGVDFLPAGPDGALDYGVLPKLVRPETTAVVCTHASNLTGSLVDLEQMAAAAKAYGLLLIVDAAQTAGTRPIDMTALGIDVLCFTGHKGLLGPQGTGGLCIREGVDVRPLLAGGTGVQSYSPGQPEEYPVRLEAGTLNAHGLAGLGAAVDYLAAVEVENIRQKEAALARRFYEGVRDLPGVAVYGDFSVDRAAIVALNIGEEDSGAVSDALAQDYGIATRPGAHCAPRLHRALGTEQQGAVRFSFSWFNTAEEVDQGIRAVAELAVET